MKSLVHFINEDNADSLLKVGDELWIMPENEKKPISVKITEIKFCGDGSVFGYSISDNTYKITFFQINSSSSFKDYNSSEDFLNDNTVCWAWYNLKKREGAGLIYVSLSKEGIQKILNNKYADKIAEINSEIERLTAELKDINNKIALDLD